MSDVTVMTVKFVSVGEILGECQGGVEIDLYQLFGERAARVAHPARLGKLLRQGFPLAQDRAAALSLAEVEELLGDLAHQQQLDALGLLGRPGIKERPVE